MLKLQEKKQLLARQTVGTKLERQSYQIDELRMLLFGDAVPSGNSGSGSGSGGSGGSV